MKFSANGRPARFLHSVHAAVLSALLLTGGNTVGAQEKKPLTFGELQTIRVMAGGTVGEALGATLPKPHLGILANRSAICSVLAGGVGSGFLRAKPTGMLTFESVRDVNDVATAVERVLPSDAVYLAFGGEWKREDNVAMLEKTLEELALHNYKGTIVFHVTTWAQRQPHDIAARNPRVAAYLRSADLRTGTLNLDAKEATLQQVRLDGAEWKLTPLAKVALRDDLVALFRRQ
ncbi:MAG: hypothetical protein NZ533_05550 [Casimicrobiaceae bacterium]|nr:hypothetical protein [Casimicrobiaceae bacterium]MDW8312235.1 hypothetical protein [Burkholderiales bacterium]